MSENAKWYVIHTYSGYENKVAATIQKTVENRKLGHLIFDIRVPMETVTEIRDTGKKEVERKMFPGYVLIKMLMTDESWYVVRNTRGVTSFVGPGSKPVPLTEDEVAALGVEKREVRLSYQVGDSVKVIDVAAGRLRRHRSKEIALQDTAGRPSWSCPCSGSETPVELKFNQVASMEK